MAVETPRRFSRDRAPGEGEPPRALWAGDDAVPRGLAVASAVALRLSRRSGRARSC